MRLVTIKKIERILKLYESIRDEYKLVSMNFNTITLKHIKCNTTFTKSHPIFIETPRCNNKECVIEFKKQNSIEKYGVESPNQLEDIKNKKRKSYMRNYGVDNPNKSEEILKKRKNTCLEKYGVESHNQLEDIKEKKKNTYLKNYNTIEKKTELKERRLKSYYENNNIENVVYKVKETKREKYGDENYCNPTKIKNTKTERYKDSGFNNMDKIKKTKKERYGNEYYNNPEKTSMSRMESFYDNKILKLKNIKPLFTLEEYKGSTELHTWGCLKCNNIFDDFMKNGKIPRCLKCYPINPGYSKEEKEIVGWLKDTSSLTIEENKRFYYKGKRFYELDIYIPEKNMGIELNGLYHHSELGGGKDKKYHIDKTNFFKNKGIQVLHIFDIEWIHKQDIVKSLLLAKLNLLNNKIYARKCNIKEISPRESNEFYNINHIQGECKSKINIGLYYKENLVACASFSKSRFNKKVDYELTRFCNRTNSNVVGGFSRLLKYFINNYSDRIITYADIRYSQGHLYKINGFKLINRSSPNYFYIPTKKYSEMHNRLQFQKHKLEDKLEHFNPNLTEWENMQENGYDRIWDCGNYVFIKK